jgi:RHS repeat-associated protein
VSSITPDASDVRTRYNPTNLIDRLDVAVRGSGDAEPYAHRIEYNARGQRIRVERGDGITTTYAYEPETFRLARLETRRVDGGRLQDLAYEYDPIGNIVSVHDGISFGNPFVSGSGLYRYDPLYWLTFAEGREHPGQQPSFEDRPVLPLPHTNDLAGLRRYREEYSYDHVGNVLRTAHRTLGDGIRTGWTRTYEYAADSNRLRATSTPADHEYGRADRYGHDANGNMSTMTHLREMRWNYANRLVDVDRGGGGRVQFAYDASGQRVRKVHVHSGLLEERVYLGTFEVYRKRNLGADDVLLERETLHLTDGAGRVALLETKTIDAIDVAASAETRVRYQLSNQLESSVLEVDPDGHVITYEEYLPFGASAVRAADASAEVSAKRYRYTGKERDEETGLYYHGARYYAAWLGRWTSADPAGFVDRPNLYSYGSNSPIGNADPTGTDTQNSCDTDPNNPLNYNTFEEFEAGAVGPWTEEGLHRAWEEAHPDLSPPDEEPQGFVLLSPQDEDTQGPDTNGAAPPSAGAIWVDPTGSYERWNPYASTEVEAMLLGANRPHYDPTLERALGPAVQFLAPVAVTVISIAVPEIGVAIAIVTALDPNASTTERVLAVASIVPVGRLLKGAGALGAVARTARTAERFENAGGRLIVYRGLSEADRATLAAGRGIVPKGGGGTIALQVAGRETRYISGSLRYEKAARYGQLGGCGHRRRKGDRRRRRLRGTWQRSPSCPSRS